MEIKFDNVLTLYLLHFTLQYYQNQQFTSLILRMIISISGLVVEYIVAIDVARVQFLADAVQMAERNHFVKWFIKQHLLAFNARIEKCILNILFWCVSFVALLRFFCLFWPTGLLSMRCCSFTCATHACTNQAAWLMLSTNRCCGDLINLVIQNHGQI